MEPLVAQKEMTEKEIGEKLKRLRKEKKLTLRQLAQAAGCTDAALSKVERGEMTPTISLLKNVVNALGITLSEFLANENNGDDSVVFHKEDHIRLDFQDEKIISYQLVRNLKNKKLQPLYEIIKPGGGSGGEYQHEGEEFGLVLEGELEITVDGKTYVVREGESFWFRSTRPHGFRNNSERDVKVIWIITPPTY